jgi:hypothetical protein
MSVTGTACRGLNSSAAEGTTLSSATPGTWPRFGGALSSLSQPNRRVTYGAPRRRRLSRLFSQNPAPLPPPARTFPNDHPLDRVIFPAEPNSDIGIRLLRAATAPKRFIADRPFGASDRTNSPFTSIPDRLHGWAAVADHKRPPHRFLNPAPAKGWTGGTVSEIPFPSGFPTHVHAFEDGEKE